MANITTVFNIPIAVTVLCWVLYKADIIGWDQAFTWSLLSFVLSVVLIAMAT
jgi:hypothetical protein